MMKKKNKIFKAFETKKETLPWEHPKLLEEDSSSHKRVKKLLKSQSYIIAEEDKTFLLARDTLGIRLELDYQKAELLLQEHGVKHTIVVFGSARILEPMTAKKQRDLALKKLNKNPESKSYQKNLEKADKIVQKSRFYSVAREFGSLVGKAGKSPSDSRITLMTGGGPGIMEAANRGAFDVGAKSIGLNISLPHEQFPNPYITPELCFQFHYFAIRKLHFLLRAKALVVFPGGFGTMDELFGIITLMQTKKIELMPVILIDKSYWNSLINFDLLEEEGMISSDDRNLFWYAQSAQEAWGSILSWYESRGDKLYKRKKNEYN